MADVCSALQILSSAVWGVFAGAQLAEGCLLVPYWQSLKPAEFHAWYATNDRRLVAFSMSVPADHLAVPGTSKRLLRKAMEPMLPPSVTTRARSRGLACIIAGAGGAAHLPGMLAAKTTVPILGVPVPSRHLKGMDSLLSIVQMPKGVPVATFAIGEAGAANAALLAVEILALSDPELRGKLLAFREEQTAKVLKDQIS